MDQSLPTMPENFPGDAPLPEPTPSRGRGYFVIPALILGVVGVVCASWQLLPLFSEEGEGAPSRCSSSISSPDSSSARYSG